MTAPADVESMYWALLSSWNNRDAAAYGALFADDASLVGFDGSPVESRASITEHLGRIFADHEPAAYVAKVREIRELAPATVLLRAVAGMVPPGSSMVKPEVHAVQVLVAVQGREGWRIAHFQNTPAAFHGRPEALDALTEELQALVGA